MKASGPRAPGGVGENDGDLGRDPEDTRRAVGLSFGHASARSRRGGPSGLFVRACLRQIAPDRDPEASAHELKNHRREARAKDPRLELDTRSSAGGKRGRRRGSTEQWAAWAGAGFARRRVGAARRSARAGATVLQGSRGGAPAVAPTTRSPAVRKSLFERKARGTTSHRLECAPFLERAGGCDKRGGTRPTVAHGLARRSLLRCIAIMAKIASSARPAEHGRLTSRAVPSAKRSTPHAVEAAARSGSGPDPRHGGAPGHPRGMRLIGLLVGVAALGCALTPKPASGEFAAVAAATPPRCSVYDATYKVDASLRITETPMGAGDGVHSIGPGTLVLRIDERKSHAELIAFDLKEHFAISPQAVLWSATVVTDASMHTRPDGGGAAAAGTLANGTLRWVGPVRGYRTDGALQCDGSRVRPLRRTQARADGASLGAAGGAVSAASVRRRRRHVPDAVRVGLRVPITEAEDVHGDVGAGVASNVRPIGRSALTRGAVWLATPPPLRASRSRRRSEGRPGLSAGDCV